MRLGTFVPQNTKFDLSRDLVLAARTVEEIGYDSVWVFERLLVPEDQTGPHKFVGYGEGPWPDLYRSVGDPLVALSMAGGATSHIRLGTAVILPPLHVPFRLAKALATLSATTGGRVIAGLGTGWSVDEHTAAAPRPLAERGAALDEFLDLAEAMWADDPVSFENERYTVTPSEVGPKPAGRIPVLLGGSGKRALRRVARRASGWLPSLTAPAQIAETFNQLRTQAAEYGRDPNELSCTTVIALGKLGSAIDGDTRRPYSGSVDQVVADIAELHAAGVEEVILTLPQVTGDIKELLGLAETFHTRVRAAGL